MYPPPKARSQARVMLPFADGAWVVIMPAQSREFFRLIGSLGDIIGGLCSGKTTGMSANDPHSSPTLAGSLRFGRTKWKVAL